MLLDHLPKKIPTVGFMCNLPAPLLADAKSIAKQYDWSMTDVIKAALATFIEEVRSKPKQTKFDFK